ncbi:MAG: hypothetical protein PF961_01825 [Planctomycetota bacterium]|nr:hypothetical protein [Planctomycetota bacterium]
MSEQQAQRCEDRLNGQVCELPAAEVPAFVEQALMDARLHAAFAGSDSKAVADAVLDAIAAGGSQPRRAVARRVVRRARRRVRPAPAWLPLVAVAAAVVVAAAWWMLRTPVSPAAPSTVAAASDSDQLYQAPATVACPDGSTIDLLAGNLRWSSAEAAWRLDAGRLRAAVAPQGAD